jgi:hypothetical protein
MIELAKYIRSVRALSEYDVLEQIADTIEAFAGGGPDREVECIDLGECAGLEIDVIRAQWAEARASRGGGARAN